MRLGVHLPQWGPAADRRGVLRVARAAEASGLDSVWVADHIVFPTRSASSYPYRKGGVPFRAEDAFLEALTTLAVVAGATERVDLGTSVLVLPMREPLLVAKSIATLDVLSGGRTSIAIGAGWWEEEFAAVGAPFAGRGLRLDAQLEVLRSAWSTGTVARAAEPFRTGEVACLPRPVRPGGPTLWSGGSGRAAFRRAVTLTDGWHGVGSRVAAIEAARDALAEAARVAGRSGPVPLSTSAGLGRSTAETTERLSALRDAGVAQVVLNIGDKDTPVDEVCRTIEQLGHEVRPLLTTPLSHSSP